MSTPDSFTWIDGERLGAMARPTGPEELAWLRAQGIQLLISLTEEPPPRNWVEDAGLLLFHMPVEDMSAPTQEQLEKSVKAIERAHAQSMGVAVHCGAGLGRTGVIVAAFLVGQGVSARDAILKVRRIRPGAIETEDQAQAVFEFQRRRSGGEK
jgi:atypical dual specificity phosphatase